MASLIPESGVIFNCADVAPPPSKDYCQIIVTREHIIFRLWKISLKNTNVCPTEVKDTHEDFLYDELTKGEVHRAFGKNFLEYIKGLARGEIDYLPRLPRHLLVKIICYLDLEDIPRLAMVSKQFLELCNSDDVWQQFYHDHNQTAISPEMSSLAEAIGWKKLFFTNKLQLQMKLRRHTAAQKSHDDSDASFCDSQPDAVDSQRDSVDSHPDGDEEHRDAVGSDSHPSGGHDKDDQPQQVQQQDDVSMQSSIYDYIENDTTGSEADVSDVSSQQVAGHHSYKLQTKPSDQIDQPADKEGDPSAPEP